MRWTAVVGLLWTLTVTAGDGAAGLPRYSFVAGRQLSYRGEEHFKYQDGSFDSISSLQVTIVGINPDGSARLIVRSGDNQIQNLDGKPTIQPTERAEDISYSQVDITSAGKVISAKGGMFPDTPVVFPPLPADGGEMDGTWNQTPKLAGDALVFRSAEPAAGGQWVFRSSTEGLFKRMYGIEQDRTYHFDLAKGIVTSIELQSKQDFGFHGSGTGDTKLESDRMIPRASVDILAKDVATLLAAKDEYRNSLSGLDTNPQNAPAMAKSAKSALAAAADKIATADVKKQVMDCLASVDSDVASELDEQKQIAAIKDKPAYDFSGTDLDGKAHKLSDYRGKVVVLDFWYRGCGWCIRSMPQMKKVAEDFQGKPVIVLGLNTDSKIEDAKFVTDAMELNYTTLRIDRDVAYKNFNVQGFPSMLLVDASGVVRDFEVGYSDDLHVRLDKSIQALLGK
jgi:peroxiredoxin